MTLGGIRANPVRPQVGKAGAGKFKKASRSFTRSSQTLVGCLVSKAVHALPCGGRTRRAEFERELIPRTDDGR